MLITENYRRLNSEYHILNSQWGNGIKFDPKSLITLCDKLDTQDVLDYGCGKASLAKSGVFNFEMKLYDPAIPEFAAKPEPADLVLCFDVLEHVEPECLDDVIKDLFRVTKRFGVYSITIIPAKAILPDGSNAHRSIYTVEEWKKKLTKFFEIVYIEKPKDSQVLFYVKPITTLEVFDGVEERFKDSKNPVDVMQYKMVEFGEWQNVNFHPAYLAYSLSQINEWFSPEPQPAREDKIAVCGFGPSLRDYIGELKKGDYKTIITTSGAHDVLIENGIIPTYHSEIDWKPHKSRFTRNAHPDCKYLIAATCHPDTIDNVKKGKAALVFPSHGPQITLPDESYVIPTGYDAGQTAMVIAKILGFRNMDLFGFDYSFTVDGRRHAGEHGGRVHFMFKARVGNRIFNTSKTMFGALLTMEYFLSINPDLHINLYSDSLLSHFLEQRQKDSLNVSANLHNN